MATQANGGQRLTITLIDPDVARVAAGCDLNAFDLVFIDDGPAEEARAATIKEVIFHANVCKLIIIHDFENSPYQQAAKGGLSCSCFDTYKSYTSVLWNERKLGSGLRSTFRRMNKAFKQHAKVTNPATLIGGDRSSSRLHKGRPPGKSVLPNRVYNFDELPAPPYRHWINGRQTPPLMGFATLGSSSCRRMDRSK